MFHDIINKVEEINKRIYKVSRFDTLELSGVIVLNENKESSGVILISDGREILFNISSSGQVTACNESYQKIVSYLRSKILELIDLKNQREQLFRQFMVQTDNSSFKDHICCSLNMEGRKIFQIS